ncbi:MAG: FHA domain-containing protein [Deinococcus sp.]|uniref:FHA domain-containing protein n=1 Tax=Deinococcus sp. TaxID=47478 RepID=UPI0026DCFE1C|nr:FHA domain-containing protein [Deinococcus sp.]MDO4245688.1 FHA domain-containing protein [Deinococcus sp.]
MSITCQVCGTVNPDGTQFCEGCGVELKNQPTAPSNLSPDSVTPPDLTSPSLPAAPSIPAPPVMPAPSLDTQASVPVELETPVETPTTEAAPAQDVSAAPVVIEAVPSPLASDANASDPAASEPVLPTPATSEGGEAAPTLNPDLTSQSDAPMTDSAPAAPLDAPVGDVAAPVESGVETSAESAATVAAAAAETRTGEAKLGIKKFGTATGDFIPLQGEKLMVGRFDASSGPVDIDLSSLPGAEHISRHHAELYREGGQWFVRDLGSTNGVFVRKGGQTAFSPRLQEPTLLTDGDELAFGNLMLTFHQDA